MNSFQRNEYHTTLIDVESFGKGFLHKVVFMVKVNNNRND